MRRLTQISAVAAEREGVSPGSRNTPACRDCVERYTPMAQVLHWLTALLMLVAVVLAWIFMEMPDTAGDRFTYITLHKSIGQTIFLLAVFRLIWRKRHPPPLMAGRLARWEARAAWWNHWLLYGIMILMPLTGYILATAAAHPSPYFWLFYWPQPPLVPALAHAALRGHMIGQFFVYAFVGLHILGAGWHVVVRRDATLDQMLPSQTANAAGLANFGRPVIDE
jgi:cytochrome b561